MTFIAKEELYRKNFHADVSEVEKTVHRKRVDRRCMLSQDNDVSICGAVEN
jgi:hypothetical protein